MSDILTHTEDGALIVTINRPEVKNAMNGAVVDGIMAALEAAAADDGVRAVVLRGAGGTFSAGGDIRDMGATDTASITRGNRRFGEMLELAQGFPKPLIAVTEGAALGGGFGLACVADITITHKDCRFGMPEVTLGLVPAQIAPFVLTRIGMTETRRLALMGSMFDGLEAARLGIAHYVEDDAEAVESRLAACLKALRRAGPAATATTKALLMGMAGGVDADTLDRAANMFADRLMSAEGQEGTSAFREKRPAKWIGGKP